MLTHHGFFFGHKSQPDGNLIQMGSLLERWLQMNAKISRTKVVSSQDPSWTSLLVERLFDAEGKLAGQKFLTYGSWMSENFIAQ